MAGLRDCTAHAFSLIISGICRTRIVTDFRCEEEFRFTASPTRMPVMSGFRYAGENRHPDLKSVENPPGFRRTPE